MGIIEICLCMIVWKLFFPDGFPQWESRNEKESRYKGIINNLTTSSWKKSRFEKKLKNLPYKYY